LSDLETIAMAEKNDKLLLYEALELRAEYDGRIKTLKACLPEARNSRDRLSFGRTEEVRYRPSQEFDLTVVRDQLKKLEVKRRKLNSAIQEANFQHQILFDGETLNLNEGLEIRKGLNEQLGELHAQVIESAYQRVIYKEDRDIVEENDRSYAESAVDLDSARRAFRALNRQLRAASFAVKVDFRDE
jgi:hypothetical protein